MRETRPEAAARALKARCRTDRRTFARFFFHEKLSDERTGQRIPFSRFQLAALEAPKPSYLERGPGEGWRRARMGPRGNGKTTIYLRVELVHDICYELERYIVVLAESAMLSRARVFEIATEIEHNERIRRYFGDLVGTEIWRRNAGEILTANGVTLLAKSMESQVRGLLHPRTNARPTKIVLDDAEDSQDVLNPELRARDRRRFTQDIEGAAAVDGTTCFQFTGTPLHREALLPSLRENPAWDFRSYPAVVSWPERMDLWERCRNIWAAAGAPDEEEDPDSPDRKTANEVALRFYRANRAEMDRGAEVLWPEHEPLIRLMIWRWTNGESAFAKEKLLVPRDPSLATFDMDQAVRHEFRKDESRGDHLVVLERGGKRRKVMLQDCFLVAFHDPCGADPSASKSKAALGDYAAIPTLAIERRLGGGTFAHVIDVWMSQNAAPSQQIEMAFELGERFGTQRHVLELDALKLLRKSYLDEREKRKAAGRFWQLPLHELTHQSTNKRARIATLEPWITNGWLTFNVNLPAVYWNQFVDDPTSDHDDGPDATEGALRCGRKSAVGLRMIAG